MVAALVAVQNVAHGLGQATLAVNVELGEGVVHSVGQTHDPREAVVIAPAPVEGGEVDASDPVDGLGQHEYGGDPDDGHGGDAADVQVAEVEEVSDVGKVSTDQTVDGVQWDGEEGN